jgi:hypothetical protein
VLKDIAGLNLHHFVSEFVNAVLEARLRTSADVMAAIQVCAALHQRYAEFTEGLIQGLAAVLLPKDTQPAEDDKDAPRKRKQVGWSGHEGVYVWVRVACPVSVCVARLRAGRAVSSAW